LPQPIELLGFLRIGAHEDPREVDVPLQDALKAADGREGAVGTNAEDDTLIERRSVFPDDAAPGVGDADTLLLYRNEEVGPGQASGNETMNADVIFFPVCAQAGRRVGQIS
jgi:hypothetical protein